MIARPGAVAVVPAKVTCPPALPGRNLRPAGETSKWNHFPATVTAEVTGRLTRRHYVNPADAELIARCIAGDSQAWEALIRKYQGRVFNIAYHMTQDREKASDLAQEAFIQILRSLPRFRGEASLSTWIHGLTMRVCLHHLRRERRRRTESWEELHTERGEPAAADRGAHEILRREQVQRLVHEAITQLPLKFRSVMVLHGLGGMTYEETALALGIPLNTVKTRVHRAKARLKLILEPELGEDSDGL